MAPSVPTKHVLLQQERISTHDKTWLPARLQPPRLPEMANMGVHDMPAVYDLYLRNYRKYLHALQVMKREHFALTRYDGPIDPEPLFPPDSKAFAPVISDMKNAAAAFRDAGKRDPARSAELLAASRDLLEKAEAAIPVGTLPIPLKAAKPSADTEANKAARKTARNRRHRQRAAAKKRAEKLASAKNIAELTVQVNRSAAKVERSKAVLSKSRASAAQVVAGGPSKKRSPSYYRRLEKRRALREASATSG